MSHATNPFLSIIRSRSVNEPQRLFAEVWAQEKRYRITWGDLGAAASAYAKQYRSAGVKSGDVIFLILKHSPELYAAFLGAMLIGAVPSFLPFPSPKQDPALYWSSHRAVFKRTAAKVLLTYPELALEFEAGDTLKVLVAGICNEVGFDFPAIEHGESSIALLQHSSGTTGLKKGVALTYRAIRLQIEAYSGALGIDSTRSIIASWLPLYHDMGLVACFMMPMYLGIPLISLDAFEWTAKPTILLDAIEKSGATHVWLPNFAFAHTARTAPLERQFNLSSLIAAIGCSEPNKPATFDQFEIRFSKSGLRPECLQACYAMAETVFGVSQTRIGERPRRLRALVEGGVVRPSESATALEYISNGPPLPGMQIAVLRDGHLHGEDVAGEICVAGPYLFNGYFGDPGATRTAFENGMFKTGDLGFLHDGEIYIFGRKKDVVIVNGRNFFAHDIEAVASEANGVKKGRCVAFGVYLPVLGSEQIVVVAEKDNQIATKRPVVSSINEAINRKFGISAGDIRIVDPGWLVKTTSGKISRAENANKYVRVFRPEAQIVS